MLQLKLVTLFQNFKPICSGNGPAKVSYRFLKHKGYLPLNVNIPSVSATGNQILAINDLNNDKLDDLIMANAQGTVLTIYYFVA
jgi:hypothetical protein